tara:strand:+ start:1023 stop:1295 length:273 start_codon:yes stop_codon:yes gene_type:complete
MKTATRLLEAYRENEEINAHSENLLLLANLFGTPEEVIHCERRAKAHRSCDGPSYEVPAHVASSVNRYHKKLRNRAAWESELEISAKETA